MRKSDKKKTMDCRWNCVVGIIRTLQLHKGDERTCDELDKQRKKIYKERKREKQASGQASRESVSMETMTMV